MPSSRKNKSTNVRIMKWLARMGKAAPKLTSGIAERLFFRPPRPRPLTDEQRSIFDRAQHLVVHVDGKSVHAWRFGRGPQVLLQHGWGGSTGRLAPLIRSLTDAGYSVLALDAPGHGASGWQSTTSLAHFARAIDALVEREGPVFAAIGHSLGGAAIAHAQARGLDAQFVGLIAPLHDPNGYFELFMDSLNLGESIRIRARARMERRIGARFADLNTARNLSRASTPTLIIHDRGDSFLRFEHSETLERGLERVELVATEGLGHSRILDDEEVHRLLIDRLDATPCDRVDCSRSAVLPGSTLRLSNEEVFAQLHYGRS